MVSYKEVKDSNVLLNDVTAPSVSVFVGGTSGIGKATIKALVSTGASMRIYLVGRKISEDGARAFVQELNAINGNAEVIWTEAEVSLLAETRRVCQVIKSKESRLDLLFLSAGFAPLGPRKETSEGLEVSQSLEYYSRMLFILHLIPLLRRAEAPRVLSVFAGGKERSKIQLDDLGLKNPKNFTLLAQMQYATMNSVFLEKLADQNPDVTFIHSCPGLVGTGNIMRSAEPNSILSWVFWLVDIIISLVGIGLEESAQRYLFQSTSACFGGRGVPWQGKPGINSLEQQANGLFLVNNKCDCTPNPKVMSVLRATARDKVWDHTQDVLGPYV